jgi:tetratricopeptide (TPR) repeat protein
MNPVPKYLRWSFAICTVATILITPSSVQQVGAETDSSNCLMKQANLISQTPMDAEYFLKRGQKLAIENRRQEAIVELNKAIELNPTYIEAYWYRCNVWASIDQPEAAIVDAEKAATLFKVQGEFAKAEVMLNLANAIREGIKAGEFNP